MDLESLFEQTSVYTGQESSSDDWDYATADTKTHTHCYHVYPAMMIPQVARRLIQLYGSQGQTLLDPFCGSGTSIVEARLAGLNAYGVDINPFAVFLARTKTSLYDPDDVRRYALVLRKQMQDATKALYEGNLTITPPRFFNIDYWFLPQVQQMLALIKQLIEQNVPSEIRDFFWVAFAHTVRESSNVRRGEYKLFRIPEEKLAFYQPDVISIFWSKVKQNLQGLINFVQDTKADVWTKIIQADMRTSLPIENGSIDLIVTSPPYGDSQTTVAYGQFSRLALQWLGFDDEQAKSIDREALGGKKRSAIAPYHSPTLDATIAQISERNERRANQVRQFYDDFADCFVEISRLCRPEAYGCFVVGNRTVKSVRIPTDRILIEIASCFGWQHHETHYRRIPNKRMPLRNSPSNKPGELGETMTEEHIVVLRKK